jgi:hypothetical protein
VPDETNARSDESSDTQLHAIRDLMLAAARRGAWLTLGEIARLTEIGEASVSAQLRHLRKRRHGRHLVEKRRRQAQRLSAGVASDGRCVGTMRALRVLAESAMWEYRVTPSTGWGSAAVAREETAPAQRLSFGSAQPAGLCASPGDSDTRSADDARMSRCAGVNPGAKTERSGDVADRIERHSGEVSDAEARN